MTFLQAIKSLITGKSELQMRFEERLKEIDKKGGPDIEKKKLEMAYSHLSSCSAFWWYEHMPVKPNTGSDRDVEMLHAKYRCSLQKTSDVPYDKRPEIQAKFIRLVLPNINYEARGFHDKEDCIKQMIKFCDSKMAREKNLTEFASPFLSPQYWLLFNSDNNCIQDGKIIILENGGIPFDDELHKAYNEWLNKMIKIIARKYKYFDSSEMIMPE